eukprot:superscaffoldBa00001797_g12053
MDQTKQEEEYGYDLFPERNRGKYKKGSIAESLFTFNNKCQVMLQFAVETSPYAKLLLSAMKSSGCKVLKDRHFSCEDCDGTVSGGFDAASSQIRAANLSGDCSFSNEVARFNFGLKQHHQECVRGRALRSILAVRKISREEAEKIVDEVFDTCFNDHAPFGRIPHSKKDAKFAYRDYENRDRYYANL